MEAALGVVDGPEASGTGQRDGVGERADAVEGRVGLEVKREHLKAQVEVPPGRLHQVPSGHRLAHLEEPLPLDAVSAGVRDVVEEPEDPVGVDPPVGAGHGTVRVLLFLAVLTAG